MPALAVEASAAHGQRQCALPRVRSKRSRGARKENIPCNTQLLAAVENCAVACTPHRELNQNIADNMQIMRSFKWWAYLLCFQLHEPECPTASWYTSEGRVTLKSF